MFKIGDFARLSRVPVKTLRYYDEIGLLKPIGVDRFTRYRYYDLEQLPVLYRILGLKELGFSLEQIGQLLVSELSPDQLRRMLERRRFEIENQIAQDRQLIRKIDLRLKEIEQMGRIPEYEVILKRLEPIWVLAANSMIASYAETETVFESLFSEATEYVQRIGVRSPGPAITIYHDLQEGGEYIQVEVGLQIPGSIVPGTGMSVYQLPGYPLAASVVHNGSFATLGNAYSVILSWIQESGYQIAGPSREIYLRYMRGGDPNQTITEIQFPVKKVEERVKMEPKIVSMQQFYIVGLPYIGKNEHNEIAQMWDVFNRRAGEIQNLAPVDAAYGVCYAHPEGMEYVAAFAVTALADIPEGMVGKLVPAQKYVVFESHGVDDIGPTYHRIIQEWLPASGYVAGDGPDFEYYGQEFDPADTSGTLYIYFPINEAA